MLADSFTKCRLLYVVGQLRDGGLEKQLYYLLKAMDRDRYRPHVLVWNFREKEKYVSRIRALRVPLHVLPVTRSKLTKILGLRTLVRNLAPEIVHSYSFFTNVAAWYAAIGLKPIPVGSVRSDFYRSLSEYGPVGKMCARWPKHQIFNSFAAAASARQIGHYFAPKHVCVVRNGIDLTDFKSIPETETNFRIVGIGSLSTVKRWDRLLTAVCALKREGIPFILEIVGDGPLRRELAAQAKDLGIEGSVEFIGRTDDVAAVLSRATLLAHTSQNEGCPNVIMEAMACGRAVVAMAAGDIPALVREGKTGFVVADNDVVSFGRRLAMLACNRTLCRRMGEAGRVEAEKHFGLSRLVQDTFAAYESAGWVQ